MFTFGCSPVLDLDNARLFAQQFPHHPLSSIAYNAFILLSGLMSLYQSDARKAPAMLGTSVPARTIDMTPDSLCCIGKDT
jgi:hypothetical protein